jgi:hypothetical protein
MYYRGAVAEQVELSDKTPLEDDEAYAAAFVQVLQSRHPSALGSADARERCFVCKRVDVTLA